MINKIIFLLGIFSILLFANNDKFKTYKIHNSDVEITIIYPKHIVQGEKVRLLGVMKNRYRNAHMGGLTISFPQFKYTKGTYSDNTFDTINSYSPPDKIYSGIVKKNIKSKYYMIEGWENNWKSGLEKRFYIEVDIPKNVSYITINVRGVLIFGKSKKYRTEVKLPLSGSYKDQQGYSVGQLSIPMIYGNTKQETMKFSLMPENINVTKLNYGKRRIYATGDIDAYATERFKRFVKNNNISAGLVVFDSPGGSLMEGIKLGKTIRNMGFDTTIGHVNRDGKHKYDGVCASACTYAFAGGLARYIHYDKQKLGVHQFYNSYGSNNEDMSITQNIASTIAKHLYEMGIHEQAFILASSTNSNSMKWFTKQEALSLNLANNGENSTTSEIKILSQAGKEQKPYLLIKQQKSYGSGKLVLLCNNNYLDILAGIVTNNEVSNNKRNTLVRNYLELDDGKFLEKKGQIGTSVKQDTLWLERKLNNQQVERLLNSNVVNIWTENGGEMRWGFDMDIASVKVKIHDFVQGCNIL